jgi:putative ABC transport system permease protein
MTIASDQEPERMLVGGVTPSLFRVLRARPAIGRLFLENEVGRGPSRVVILGFGLWQRRFGGRVDIIGTSVRLDGQPYTVVGVMPREFAFPSRETEAWTPLGVVSVNGEGGVIRLMMFSAMARLRSGVTVAQAATEATTRARGAPDLKQTAIALFGSNGIPGVTAAPAIDVMTAEVRPALLILLAAVGLLFLASTASLIVLQLSRVARRSREIAVRVAIGAGGARLVRQWLVESAFLGLAGAATGLIVATMLHRGLPAVLPASFPRVDDVRIDWRVAVFACGVAILASLACGMVPAFRRRDGRVDSLAQGAVTTPAVTRTPAARVRTVLMAGQVAVACVLLVGGLLLARSFFALVDVDRGFDPRGILTMRVPVPAQSNFAKYMSLLERLHMRLGTMPGVTDVAFGNALPFVTPGLYSGMDLFLPRDPSAKVEVQAIQRAVSPEYFRAMRLRVGRGRPIASSDTESSVPVVVVNRTFASRYLGDNAIGQHLTIRSDRPSFEVIGVVDDMRQGNIPGDTTAFGGVLNPPQAEMFFSHRQWPYPIEEIIIVIRTTGDPAALAADARAIIRDQDSSLPVDSMMTMEARVAGSLAGPRSYMVFLVGFALCALAIAAVGLFGVLSYTTSQRAREIGVRVALGAAQRDIAALVARQAFTMTVGGLLVGLIAAFFLSQSLSTLLFGISARDALSFSVVPLILIVASLAACAAPTWRATRIDPMLALRSE